MGKRIEYHRGQIIGPYGLIYIKEAEPYIQPSNNRPMRQAYFECPHCENHTIFITRIAYAKNGHTKSCGCRALEASIKTIQEYNELKLPVWNRIERKPGDYIGDCGVIYLSEEEPYIAPKTGKPYRRAKFKCPVCGDSFIALMENVSQNKTKGCDKHISQGEEKIDKILKELGYNFERQKTFPDLKSEQAKRPSPLFFDFYLSDYNICLEYDGIQHYSYKEETDGWNTKENFEKTIKRDKQKNEYCKTKDIPLIRIPYTDFDKLDTEYLQNKIKEYLI